MDHRIIVFMFFIFRATTFVVDNVKEKFCSNLSCEDILKINVCGIREEGIGYRLKLFENECELLKFGCRAESQHAYGIIDMEYCEKLLTGTGINLNTETAVAHGDTSIMQLFKTERNNICNEYDCNDPPDGTEVCGIRADGAGFRVTMFPNECELFKHNCDENLNFTKTEDFICKGYQNDENSNEITDDNINDDQSTSVNAQNLTEEPNSNDVTEDSTNDDESTKKQAPTEDPVTDIHTPVDLKQVKKNLIVLDGSMLDYNGNINETMDKFFASTHARALPLTSVDASLNETTRRRLVNIAGPVMVFKPWINIPSNISTDKMHEPTLSSCFHKCPQECPDTYTPVCGVPGIVAREPSLMFKNHCFMDAAQCKMRWEDKGSTSESSCGFALGLNPQFNPQDGDGIEDVASLPRRSLFTRNVAYIESSFVICLGDELNGLYRFLPLIRSLQHMGRLKWKGHFRYRMRNMKFFNHLLSREPKLMG